MSVIESGLHAFPSKDFLAVSRSCADYSPAVFIWLRDKAEPLVSDYDTNEEMETEFIKLMGKMAHAE